MRFRKADVRISENGVIGKVGDIKIEKENRTYFYLSTLASKV